MFPYFSLNKSPQLQLATFAAHHTLLLPRFPVCLLTVALEYKKTNKYVTKIICKPALMTVYGNMGGSAVNTTHNHITSSVFIHPPDMEKHENSRTVIRVL